MLVYLQAKPSDTLFLNRAMPALLLLPLEKVSGLSYSPDPVHRIASAANFLSPGKLGLFILSSNQVLSALALQQLVLRTHFGGLKRERAFM